MPIQDLILLPYPPPSREKLDRTANAVVMTLRLPKKDLERKEDIHNTKTLLKEQIRDDWTYPPLSASQKRVLQTGANEDGEENVAGVHCYAARADSRDGGIGGVLDFEPMEWRERNFSSEEDKDEGDGHSVKTTSSRGSKQSECLFDAPESVGLQVSARRRARQDKQQTAVDDESGWNEGLAHWTARRNAWCCARQSPSQAEPPRRRSTTSNSSSRTSTLTASSDESAQQSSTTAATTPDPAPAPTFSPPFAPLRPSLTSTFLPVAPTLLPNNPIRRRINPSVYADIYFKVITHSRTPSVPINLSALVAALVEGWKNDGEWPPKSTPLEPAVARRKKGERGLKSSVKAVGRAFGLTGVGEGGKGEG